LLQGSDVFVLPTLADPMPRVILEAMACGLPVITTPDAGHEEIIEDGVNGFIVPVNDAEAVAALLVRLSIDRELCERVGRAARATAEQNTWDVVAERFRKALHTEILPVLAGLRPAGE
jgi:glycosyltransferase involved in cell wall biosynthesis